MYLFFDTETTGLPKSWNAPATDVDNWPRLVQLAWQLYDAQGTLVRSGDHIVKPEGFIVPPDAARVHGITHERALAEGVPVKEVLSIFEHALHEATHLVAHNMSFDEKIMGAEFLRIGKEDLVRPKQKICTMLSTIEFCALPSGRGYKWPKLAELHHTLFGEDFAEAHNAAADIGATAKCFWELGRRGIIDLPIEASSSPRESTETAGKHGGQLGLFS